MHPINILLIGAGWFGKNHLRVWLALEKLKKINLVGVVEKSKALREKIKKEYRIPVFDNIDVNTLKHVDAVDIVTTTNTHFELAKKCLRYANVFVEKPLAETVRQARELKRLSDVYGRVLMVGHIFRFHPIIKALKLMFSSKSNQPYYIRGEFISPFNTWKKGKTAALDNLHLFDILDDIFEKMPIIISGRVRSRVTAAELYYPNGMYAVFELGWRGEEKERILDFYLRDKIIHCDFGRNFIEIRGGGKQFYELKTTPLEMELETFLKAVKKKNVRYADGNIGARIVNIANQVDRYAKKNTAKA
ncbi:MAG: Gfo/Idh/MocA family oxidoreductase [Patescibacteria group bacterium]